MKLCVPEPWEVQLVRDWRNSERQFLRTPHMLTPEMQQAFYDRIATDAKDRYFSIRNEKDNASELVGFGGLTNTDYINGHAEISLIVNPAKRGRGYGRKCVDLLLDEAFGNMRLHTVYGEVYNCGNRVFWEKLIKEKGGYSTDLINRKYWEGELYGSMWFAFGK